MSGTKSLVRLSATLLFACVVSPPPTKAQTNYENYTFLTFAGLQESPGWFDGTNSAATFFNPFATAVDKLGNVYVADTGNQIIRKIAADGRVTTLAGLAGHSGTNDGIGALARFANPQGLVVDAAGNVYVADTANHTIRKITPNRQVTTFAGSPGLSGTNNGMGSSARFAFPNGLAVDTNNNVYVADTANHTVRAITPAGLVSTLAGKAEFAGTNNGSATAAQFDTPYGVAVDTSNNVYVADTYNHTIRKISSGGVVTILAGLATVAGTNNGTGTAAQFYGPTGVGVDGAGNLYVADYFNQTIRKVTSGGAVTTVAGMVGSTGNTNATGSMARFYYPAAVAVDATGKVFIADYGNHLIRAMTSAAAVTNLAGRPGGLGFVDGVGSAARFNFPAGVALDTNKNVFVADLANHIIRKITPTGGVTTLAGSAGVTGTNNGTGTAARFNTPSSVAVDTNGNVYVADTYNHVIRRITSTGVVTNFAGLSTVSGTNNGTGPTARFYYPYGVAVGTNSTLYVADTWNHMIRKISPAGVVSTLAGSTNIGSADGAGVAARFYYPQGIVADASGNVYVGDRGNHTIRKITAAGVVTTLAGLAGNSGFADGVSNSVRFDLPFGVAVDSLGNVFVSDFNNHAIRKITPAGVTTTLAGTPGLSGASDGTGSAARFNTPEGVAIDQDGTLYVADANNHSIRKGYPTLPDMPVVDVTSDKPGVLRHLDVTNLTTTGWSWSIVRYPANAVAQLSATTIKNPTFTPDLADLYAFRFEGTNSAGKRAIGILDLSGVGTMQPYLKQIQKLGANVVLTGNGGAPGTGYSVLKSPDTALPVGSWSVLPGSTFDNNGAFAFTNAVNGSPNFYKLRVP